MPGIVMPGMSPVAADGLAGGGEVAGMFMPGISGMFLDGAPAGGVAGMFMPGMFICCARDGEGSAMAASAAGHSHADAPERQAIRGRLAPTVRPARTLSCAA